MSGSYLFSVHAQVGCPSRHRDTSFCQFDEVLLNPTGNLECFNRKMAVLIISNWGTAAWSNWGQAHVASSYWQGVQLMSVCISTLTVLHACNLNLFASLCCYSEDRLWFVRVIKTKRMEQITGLHTSKKEFSEEQSHIFWTSLNFYRKFISSLSWF